MLFCAFQGIRVRMQKLSPKNERYTVQFANDNKETFMSILKERTKAKNKREPASAIEKKKCGKNYCCH